MNTTATTLQISEINEQAIATTHRPTVLRRFAGILAAFLFATAGLFSAGAATPAHAASYGRINTCVKFLWGGGSGAWAYDTNLQANVSGAYYNMLTFRPSTSNGCISIPVPSGYAWRFTVSTRLYGSRGPYCSMTSRSIYVQTGYTYNMGTLWVTCK